MRECVREGVSGVAFVWEGGCGRETMRSSGRNGSYIEAIIDSQNDIGMHVHPHTE